MEKRSRKRKQQTQSSTKRSEAAKLEPDPYPDHSRPTPEECLAVRDDLLALHGFPQEFAKYRKQRQRKRRSLLDDEACTVVNAGGLNALKSEPFDPDVDDDDDDDDDDEPVLDGLVRTVLSQNTTEVNAQRAFDSLKAAFHTWEDVLAAESKCIENAIRCGGLAPTKASCIKNTLDCLLRKKGKLSLEYLRELSVDEIKNELSNFKGIGPKTVACVLMFNLQRDDFPVDTHVFEIGKAIGWLPAAAADRNKAYIHLNRRIPNELKFDLNCLLFTHGKLCCNCSKKGGKQHTKKTQDKSCPLLNYCNKNLSNKIN